MSLDLNTTRVRGVLTESGAEELTRQNREMRDEIFRRSGRTTDLFPDCNAGETWEGELGYFAVIFASELNLGKLLPVENGKLEVLGARDRSHLFVPGECEPEEGRIVLFKQAEWDVWNEHQYSEAIRTWLIDLSERGPVWWDYAPEIPG